MKNIILLIIAYCSLLHFANGQSYTISTIAGNGTAGYTGDGGQATAAELSAPNGIAIDTSGNIYFVDNGNNRIRKVSTNGHITTIAGNGTASFSGDGGQATAAEINTATWMGAGLAVDNSGNIYFSDNGNDRIRMINTSGTISTFAGNGSFGYSGDGAQATAAELNIPEGIARNASGNLYIGDDQSSRGRKISSGGVITTFAGSGTAGYSGDNSQATAAELYHPWGIAVDGSGNTYIADQVNCCIRKVNAGGVITTVAGTGVNGYSGDGGNATAAELSNPGSMAIDGIGNIYFADVGNSRVRKIAANGTITTIAGNGSSGYSGDGGSATAAELTQPWGIAIDKSGNLYVSDYGNNTIRKLTKNTVGLENISINSKLDIYPNPTSGIFTISSSKVIPGAKVDVYELSGKLVYSERVKSQTLNIDLSDKPKGVYLVKVSYGEKLISTKRLIMQ